MSFKNQDNDVWLVLYTKTSIEVVGIFTTEQLARSYCKDEFYVVGPFELNKDYTDITDWVGAYRPYGGDLYPARQESNNYNE